MKLRWALVPIAPLVVLILLRAAYSYNPLAPLFYIPAMALALRSAYRFARHKPVDAKYLWLVLALGLHPFLGLAFFLPKVLKAERGWVRYRGILPRRASLAFRLVGKVQKADFIRVANGEAYIVVESAWFTSSGAYRRALGKARVMLKRALEMGAVPIPVRAREVPKRWDSTEPLGLPRTDDVPAIFAIGAELERAELQVPAGFVGILADGRPWAMPSWQARAMVEAGLCKGDPKEFPEEPPPDPSNYGIKLGPARPLGLYEAFRLKPFNSSSKPSNIARKNLDRALPLSEGPGQPLKRKGSGRKGLKDLVLKRIPEAFIY